MITRMILVKVPPEKIPEAERLWKEDCGALLIEQAVRPVRWEESVRKLEELGCGRVWEVGPGKVLRGLIKRITASLDARNFDNPEDLAVVRGGAAP